MPTVTKKYYHNIDLDNNQLINAVVENLATAPVSPVDGQIYYNTVDKKIYYYKDSTAGWIAIGSDVVYQVPITLTTTGTSGPATFNAGTGALNIPQYTAGITGSGTTNYLSKWSGTTALGNSVIYDNGSVVSIGTGSPNTQARLTLMASNVVSKSVVLDSTWDYQTSFAMKNGNFSTEFNLGGASKSAGEGGPGSLQVSTYNATTFTYRYPITFFANANVAFAGPSGSVPSDNGATVQVNGTVYAASLVGTGNRMVIALPTGFLSTQAIPAGVSSVGLSVPTGLSVANSPITSSGTLAINYAAGYSIPTTLSQSNWDTAYGWGNHALAGYLPVDNAVATSQFQLWGPGVTSYSPYINTLAAFVSDVNDYQLFYVQNINSGSEASADFVAYNDVSAVDSFYIDMGINSSNYSSAIYPVFPANSGYVFTGGGSGLQPSDLYLGTITANSDVVVFAGGYNPSDIVLTVTGDTKNVIIGTGLATDTGEKVQVTGDVKVDGVVRANAAYATSDMLGDPHQLTTKEYVDNQVSAGLHVHEPVRLESSFAFTATYTQGGTTPTITSITSNRILTSVGHSLSVDDMIVFDTTTNGITGGITYFVYEVLSADTFTISETITGPANTALTNGTGLSITSRANSGVGARLTNAGTQAALVVDGVAAAVSDRILIYNQAVGYWNGVYVVISTGSGSTNWILERAADACKYGSQSPNAVGGGDYFYVKEGVTGAGESYVINNPGDFIIGTDTIVFTLFNAAPTYTGSSPISVVGQSIQLTGIVAATHGGTGVGTVTTGDLLYGSAANTWSKLPIGVAYKSLLVNASGTNLEWNALELNQPAAVSGQLGVANGGTGAATLTGILVGDGTNAVTAVAGTASQLLRKNGGNTGYEFFTPSYITLTSLSATSPVLYNNTTGVFSIQVANTTQSGYLSSTDWNTFNGKQAQLSGTGFVKISGTTISYDNNTYYLASNPNGFTNNTGTVTSVAALTIGTTGTDLSSSVATGTTTPVITLNVPTASATNRGALSSADWSTFNGKQAALNGTGFVKISGTTISYDNSTYYLASNPSGYTTNTGTVTTVSVTTANGVSGSVATAGTTPAITITLGAITPTSVNSVVLSGSATPTLAVTGTSSISGSNTGDNAVNSLYSGLVSNATHAGDATGSTELTVTGILGVPLPALDGAGGVLRYTGILGNAWFWDSTAYLTANQSITLSGDVSGTGSTAITTTIGANKVTNAMLAQVPTATFKGRTTAATGNVENLTATQATALLDVFSSTLKGLAPASGGGTTNFLRADGTWAAPAGGGGGSVTSVSVVSANGFAGTVATASSTPAITISTTITGLLKGDGTAISAAVAGTDYQGASTNLTSLAGLTFASTSFVKMTAAGTFALDTNTYYLSSNPSGYTSNTGTVTTVSVTTANGISGSVATAGTTPAITLTLGAITPTSVNSVVISGSATPTLAVTGASSISGSNTGDNAVNSLYSGLVSNATHTGDATGSTALTVVGLRGVALPALGASAGFLRYTGTGTNTWVFDTSTYLTANQSITLSGDISGTGTTAITTSIGANKVTNAMLAQVATASFLGRVTAATGNVETLTATQATSLLDVFSSTLKGLVPASGGGTTNFLRADGTWAAPTGGAGTVTTVSVVSANGFAGTVATASSTPAITISTTVTGVLKGNGTAISAAVANTDYLAVATPTYTGVLTTGTLSFTPANHFAALATSASTYNQLITQNISNAATASNDIVVNNNLSTDTANYGDFGINSSTFTGSGSFSLANAVYLYAHTGDLVVGTYTSNAIHFVINNGATDAATIKTTGQLQLPGYTTTTSFTGTTAGYLAFDASGNILTVAAPTGGSGSPGGTVNEIQYNDGAGGFAGAANVEINSGNLKLVSTTDPAAPTGGLLLYSKVVGGRHLPKMIGPSGVDTVMQVGLHGNSVFMVAPANGTTAPTAWGGVLTTATTISHQQTIASSSPWLATRRTRFQTAATANNATGMRTGYTQWFRGSVSGYGGFWFRAQLGANLNIAGGQKFVGLCNSTGALAGEPSALLNMCGMGYDSTDAIGGNWFFMYNDGTGTATKVDLGAANAARANTTHGYDLVMYMAPGGSELFVRIINLHTNVTVLETSYTTLLPVANTGMAFKAEVRTTTATADNLEIAKVYIETDY